MDNIFYEILMRQPKLDKVSLRLKTKFKQMGVVGWEGVIHILKFFEKECAICFLICFCEMQKICE